MNRKGHIRESNLHGDVVDLKSFSRSRRTPIPAMIAREVKRYPAQAPTRVFAPSAPRTPESLEASLYRSRREQVSKIRDAEKVTMNTHFYATTTSHVSQNKEVRHLWKSSRTRRFLGRVVVGLLVPMMLVHPLARVYADEVVILAAPLPLVSEPATNTMEATSAQVNTEASNALLGNTALDMAVASDANIDLPNVEDAASIDDTEVFSPTLELPPSGDDDGNESAGDVGGATDGDVGTTTETTASDFEVATSTQEDIASTTLNIESLEGGDTDVDATTTEEVLDESVLSESEESSVQQKSTDEIAAEEAMRTERLRTELRREVEQEFLRGCISFETSGYYCLNDGARKSAPTTTVKVITTVESVEGIGGDKEIFVVKNGVRTALTANDWDDTFPTQDISGEKFVWQGMKAGRWQIFTGSISASGVPLVTQVTDSRESNFNPKIDGNYLVWQGWADDNWEIFFATARDAESPFVGEHLPEGNALLGVGPEWAVERLTKNSNHDMFPSLHGDIVTWQSRAGNDWVVYAYSIGAKKLTKLSSDGVKGENPRFSITWEERDQEGNARLVGYDLSTGEKTDLTKTAMRLPGETFPEPNKAPITQSDPAALPVTQSSGTSTPQRGDDEGAGDNPVLP